MNIFTRIKSIFGNSTINLVARRSFGSIAMSKQEALSSYETNTVVYSAIKKRAEKVGQVEFQLFRGETEVTNNPILDLLNRPNTFQSKSEFFELYQSMKDLTGEVYVWKFGVGKGGIPQELFILRSDRVKIITDKAGDIIRYEYRKDNQTTIKYEPEDIFYSMHSSPMRTGSYEGLPLPRAGTRAIRAYDQLDDYQSNVLKNGGKVEGILRVGADSLDKEQIQELKEQWSQEYAGATKAGTPMISYGDMEYSDIGLTPKELSYIESKNNLRDDISMLFGVPKVLLGQVEGVNYGSAEVAHRIFLRETIKPLLDNLVDKLNYFLVPDNFDLRYIDPTPEDTEMRLKQVESGIQNGYLTINEAREHFNLDPVKGGDVPLIGLGRMPLSYAEERPVPQANEGRSEKSVKKKFVHPLSVKAVRDVYRREVRAKQDRDEMKFGRTLRKYTDDQMSRILQGIGGKSWKLKNILDEAWNETQELRIGEDLFKPLMQALAQEAGKDVAELFNLDGAYNLSDGLRTTLDKRIHFFVREINHTTFQQLQNAFAENLEQGGDRQTLIKKIRETYGDITKVRAKTIARTEVHTAVQQANLDAYRQFDIPTKIWTAVVDDVTRDSHLAIDGEEVSRESAFSNGLMMAGDPNGSADEVINCRCAS